MAKKTQANQDMIKMIEDVKKKKKQLTHITDKTKLSTEDKIKLGLCRHFVQYASSKKLKLQDIAQSIGLPLSRLSEIVNYKINKFTVDQLIKNLSLLAQVDPQVKEYLVFLEQAVELPTLKVQKTKELTKNIREAAEEHASL